MLRVSSIGKSSDDAYEKLEQSLATQVAREKAYCEKEIQKVTDPERLVELATRLRKLESDSIAQIEELNASALLENITQVATPSTTQTLGFLASLITDEKARAEAVERCLALVGSNGERLYGIQMEQRVSLLESIQGNHHAKESIKRFLKTGHEEVRAAAARAAKGIHELTELLQETYEDEMSLEVRIAMMESFAPHAPQSVLKKILREALEHGVEAKIIPAFRGRVEMIPDLLDLMDVWGNADTCSAALATIPQTALEKREFMDYLKYFVNEIPNRVHSSDIPRLEPLFKALRGEEDAEELLLKLAGERRIIDALPDPAILNALGEFPEGRVALHQIYFSRLSSDDDNDQILIDCIKALAGHEDSVEFLLKARNSIYVLSDAEIQTAAMSSLIQSEPGRQEVAKLFETSTNQEERLYCALGSSSKEAIPFLKRLISSQPHSEIEAIRAIEKFPDEDGEILHFLRTHLFACFRPEATVEVSRILSERTGSAERDSTVRSIFLASQRATMGRMEPVLNTLKNFKYPASTLLRAGIMPEDLD